jgi:hypothetical protein
MIEKPDELTGEELDAVSAGTVTLREVFISGIQTSGGGGQVPVEPLVVLPR